jgi:hypothetical protein
MTEVSAVKKTDRPKFEGSLKTLPALTVVLAFALAMALALSAAAVVRAVPGTVNALASGGSLPEFPFADDNDKAAGSLYPASSVEVAGAGSVAAAGGEGNVIVLKNTGEISEAGVPGAGFTLDFTQYKLSGYGIRSITIKVYVPAGVKEISVTADGGETHLARYSLSGFQKEKWTEFSLYDDGLYFLSGKNIIDMTNERGQLGAFSYNFLWPAVDVSEGGDGAVAAAEGTVYVDSVTLELIDGAAGKPYLKYDGADVIDQTAGKTLLLGKAEAFDEFENRELPVTMRWEGTPGVDEAGLAVEGGPYTLVLEAENSFLEKVSKTLTVKVRPRDNEPPRILAAVDSLRTYPGTYGTMNVFATDNEDPVEVKVTWSRGALDDKGRLQPGEHEVTLYAEDLTGNSSTRVIAVSVPETEDGSIVLPDNTRDESTMRFGLPVWAVILIAGAAACIVILLIIIIFRKVRKMCWKRKDKKDKKDRKGRKNKELENTVSAAEAGAEAAAAEAAVSDAEGELKEAEEKAEGVIGEAKEAVEEDTRMTAEYVEWLEKNQSRAEGDNKIESFTE